jgi:glycosyltransferase involved in cell wall biosynthesis
LPVRNEGLNLKVMLKMLRAFVAVPHEVIVVYDDPRDTSLEVAEASSLAYTQLRGVENKLGRGVINAIRAGVEAAVGEYILIFAADEVGPVMAIDNMLALMNQGCELVSCTRYAMGGRRLGGSLIGHFLSKVANKLIQWTSGSVLSDGTTGIKMFRRSIFPKLGLEAKPVGWAVAFEMSLKAQHIGLKLGEVPIVSIDRLFGGKSSFRLVPWCREYFRWFMWGTLNLRRGVKMRRRDVLTPGAPAPR